MASITINDISRIRLATYDDMANPEQASAWLAPVWQALLSGWTEAGLQVVQEFPATLELLPNNAYHGQQVRHLGETSDETCLALTLDWTIAITDAQLGGCLEFWVGRLANGREVERVDMQIGLFSANLDPEWRSVWFRSQEALLADFNKRQNGKHRWADAYVRTKAVLTNQSLDWITP